MRLPDAYTWRARTLPVLVTCLPALVLVGGGMVSQSRLGVVTGTAIAVLAAVAAQLGRDRGRRLQPGLWESWGGSPTLQGLRHRGAARPDSVDRLHRRIEDILGETMPTAAEETADPAAADARYDDVVADIRQRTYDREKFPLVFEENTNYGFRRNMLGLRPWGLGTALLTLIVAVTLLLAASGSFEHRAPRWALPAAVALLLAVFWWRAVTPGWVRVPADAYAARLMQSVDALRAPPAA